MTVPPPGHGGFAILPKVRNTHANCLGMFRKSMAGYTISQYLSFPRPMG